MWKSTFFFFNYLADFFLLAILIYSTININKISNRQAWVVIIYCFFTFFINSLAIVNLNRLIEVSIMNYWILFSIIHTFLIMYLIKLEFLKLRKISNLNRLFSITIALQSIFCLYDLYANTYYSATYSNLIILITLISYYIIYFKSSLVINNYKNKSGLLLLKGIFLSTSFITPIILFGKYAKSIFFGETYYAISLTGPISSIILYYYFFKTLLCFYKNPA